MSRFFWDLLSLILANAVGFFAAHFCYIVGVKMGIFQVTSPDFDPAVIQVFFNKSIMLWLICGFFSLLSLLLRGPLRYVFLLAPAVVPMAYGFSVLFLS